MGPWDRLPRRNMEHKQIETCRPTTLQWVIRKRALCFPAELQLFGADQGSLGDLCRATSGEGETEPKQIGEGSLVSTEPQASPET
jgi:hypothetical protein